MNVTTKNFLSIVAAAVIAGSFAVSPMTALAEDFGSYDAGGWGYGGYDYGGYDSGGWGYGSTDYGSYDTGGWGYGSSDYSSYDTGSWGYGSSDYGSYDSGGWGYANSDYGSYDSGSWGYANSDYGSYDAGAWGYANSDYGSYDAGSWGYGSSDYGSYDAGAWGYANSDYGSYDAGAWGYSDSDYGSYDAGAWGYADSDYGTYDAGGWGYDTQWATDDWGTSDNWGIAQDDWGIAQDDWGYYGDSQVVWDDYGGYFGGISWGSSWGGDSYGGCSGSSCRPPCRGSSCHVASCTGNSCDDDLDVTCDVSDTRIEKGDCVTYEIDVNGGDSPFQYSWSGDTEGEGGNHRTIEVCYDDEGTYRVTGRVHDDNDDTDSDSCPAVVVDDCSGDSCDDDDEDLEVECEVSDDNIEEGDSVTFTANVDGGDSPFTYDWSDDVDSSNRSFSARFNNSGTYTAKVKVTDDDGDTATDTCTVRVEDEDDDEDFDIECRVSDRTIDEGDCVTYSVNVDGGDSPFDYDWNGDIEGEDDDNRTIRVCYDDEGDYEVSVVVTDDDNNRESDACPSVEVDGGHRNSSGRLASVDAIYLSQIPYTGPEDMLKLAGFGTAILGVGLGSAVALRKRKDRKTISDRIAAFKAANLSRN